ncbi:glycosyltransferase family 4 protein [Ornithinimicrobium pratense]|uniref:D-inositol 3-phosphate glycosyltransferase n=1 Tax=Ornithinimicrobium pratense TaxID=2593973 RepID=A0A5J6V973_9MICO|nr:glycosyltransferase family 4 protein [Ornithinimicrobium pratense]QFG70027.1 glycosyltransferase [Ornithinimicrobium pratense]
MHSRRFVLVGTRVERTEVQALARAAAEAGLDVRAAAQRPPDSPGAAVPWHRVPAQQGQAGWGGAVASWVTRAARGPAAPFAEQLAADPWLTAQVAGTEREVLLVALDDPAAQALARWRSETGATDGAGRPVPVLTWDQGAETLAEEIATATRAGSADLTTPGAPEGRLGRPADPSRPLGAKHRLTVVAGGDGAPRQEVRAALTGSRVAVTLVDLDQVPQPDLTDADAVVLDGLGPAVLLLGHWPGLRIVHLQRATDRRSPWRHLVPPGRIDHVLTPPVGDALTRGDAGAAHQVLAAALDEDTVRLLRTTADAGDDAALALAAQLTEDLAPGTSPAVLRELHFLARATGSLTLERTLLHRQLELPSQPVPTLREALDRVTERLRETEPGWLPALPPASVEPLASGRVLHLLKVTLPQRQAGYSVRAHQTLKALAEAGVDVVAVAAPQAETGTVDPDDGPQDPMPPVEETVLDGVRYLQPAPVPGGPPTAFLKQQARAVLDVVRQERPALLHVHSGGRGYDLGVVGAAVAQATGLPWVYEVRGLFESLWTGQAARAERGETFARRMAKEAELVNAADAAVTLAGTMRDDLVARGVDPEQVTLVPNAVDPGQLVPAGPKDLLASRWGTRGAFTFGYITNLDHQREQVEDLIRAAVILRDTGLTVRVLVVGDGPRRAHLEETTRQWGAGDVVTFTGRVPHAQVAQAYALLDVLVVPRSDERAARLVTPLKPYEAMAMGVPIVVSAQPALLEVIGDGERGWSYPAGDAPALARLLQRLAADPARRAAVAARARDWVVQERTWAGNAHRYAALYGSVLQGRTDATG